MNSVFRAVSRVWGGPIRFGPLGGGSDCAIRCTMIACERVGLCPLHDSRHDRADALIFRDCGTRVNYGEYEVVGALLQGPHGASGMACLRGNGGQAFHIKVQHLDPIAEPGRERIVVDEFLEETRLQQAVGGAYWETIHAVGETDEGAYRLSDHYPRSAAALINGNVRLASADLQHVVVSILRGLIDLRDRVGGRAHGRLKPEHVLIDDRQGPGKWKIVLSQPSPVEMSGEALEKARGRDAKSVGAIVLGLVEHRQPRPLPLRVEVNDAWKRVCDAQAGAWVASVNRLLDPDLDPTHDWLDDSLEAFSSIKTRSGKPSRWPVVVGVVVLALAAGGGYFALTQGKEKEQDQLVIIELTFEDWERWIRASRWVPGLEAELGTAFPVEARGALSPAASKTLQDLLAKCPPPDELRKSKGATAKAWTPEALVSDSTLPSELFIKDEEGHLTKDADPVKYQIAATKPDVERKAEVVLRRVRDVEVLCANPPGREDLSQLMTTLREWGASEAQLRGLEAAIKDLSPETIGSSADVVGLIRAVDAGAAAQSVADGLRDAVARSEAIVQTAPETASGDPVLSRLPAIVKSAVVHSLDEGRDASRIFESLRVMTTRVDEDLDRQAAFMESEYGLVSTKLFHALLEARGFAGREDFEVLGEWRNAGRDKSVVLLVGENDPFLKLREAGGVDAFFAAALTDIARVRELPQADEEAQIIDGLFEIDQAMVEIRVRVDAALAIEPTQANADDLAARLAVIQGLIQRDVRNRAQTLVGMFSKTLDDAVGLLGQQGAAYPNDPTLNAAHEETRTRLLAQAEQAKSLPTERERNIRAAEIIKAYQSEQVRLDAIALYTDQTVEIRTTPSIDPAPLRRAFDVARQGQRQILLGASDAVPEGKSPVLRSLAGEVEAAVDAAAAIESRMDAWADVGTIDAVQDLSPTLIGDAGMRSAFDEAIAALRGRLSVAASVAGTPVELLGIARDVERKPELRRAAFESIAGGGIAWPASADDLRLGQEAGESLVAGMASATNSEWSASAIADVTKQWWRAAMENAPDEASFMAVRQMREAFGLDLSEEDALPEVVRRNIAFGELRMTLAALTKLDDSDADDAAVRQLVNAWLAENEAVVGQGGWLDGLKQVMADENVGGGDFDPGLYGPGAAGWTGSNDEDINELSYQLRNWALKFRRVTIEDTETVWFLGEEEVSLGLMIEFMGEELVKDEQLASGGPRGWMIDGGNVLSAASWFEHRTVKGVGDLRDNPLFAPSISVPGQDAELTIERSEDKDDMPVQHMTLEAAQAFCRGVGCVLPPVEVWQAAAQAQYAQAGMSGVGITASSAQAFGLQVRDAMWTTQNEYFESLSPTGAENRRFKSHEWWSDGIFKWGSQAGDDAVWGGVDDGRLYFAPVNSGRGGPWSHLVGNVAEIVTTGGGFAAIGASAMSPPDVAPGTPVPFVARNLPAADIGFRLAFSVPASDLNPSLRRRVTTLLENAPQVYPSR